jgi:hypothetical protein
MTTKLRRPRYRTLREDYVEFCGGNTVSALLLDYFASADRLHDEAREQGERRSKWRAISTRQGGKLTVLSPKPSRETMRKALDTLCELGLFDAHPDNDKPVDPKSVPGTARFRLNAHKLLRLEHEWMLHANKDNEGMVAHATTGGSADVHTWQSALPQESVLDRQIEERETPSPETDELPDHLSAAQRRAIEFQNTEVPRPNGDGGALAYTLIDAACDAWDIVEERYRRNLHTTYRKASAQLADMGATPEEVKAIIAERRAKGKQPDEYPMEFMARDYVGWKSRMERATPAPRVLSDTDKAAADKALEAERRAWREAQGLA